MSISYTTRAKGTFKHALSYYLEIGKDDLCY
jgi:hypothetical protein